MRIINKKYLLIIMLVGVILTGVIVLKPKEKVQLDNVILKQEVNSKTFAMYKEEGNEYVPVEDNKFPEMYVLNLTESKCIDNNGNELNGVLSYENGNVTITSGITTYCYLYFDKTLGLEIKEKTPKGLSLDKERGEMYRFQGQQSEGINNYICFGTSDKNKCISDTDHYMYRIIGIEAETGRVKVIKKESLKETESGTYKWYTDYVSNIEFPQSIIYNAINGIDFLKNTDYIPEGWEEKIATNTWLYGDIITYDILGANQTGEELYLVETGQKGTIWDEKAEEGDPGATLIEITDSRSPSVGETIYYIRRENEKWTQSFTGKISLMYLHDYYYSVGDMINCQSYGKNYDICKTGWMHFSQNDTTFPPSGESTMSRYGLYHETDWYDNNAIYEDGAIKNSFAVSERTVRPVFYINASQKLKSGTGTLEDPFIIKS